jgi:transposase-like protein
VVIELLKGESLESLSRRHGVTAAKLSQWRDDFLAGGEARLRHREVVVEDEDTRRLKSVVADHCTAECVGLHAAKYGTRFEAVEPVRQGVRDHFGGMAARRGAPAHDAPRPR